MKQFGLIGYPLGHSFSRKYFTEKFKQLGLNDHQYDVFELEFIDDFPALWKKHPELVGVNVTVPHKQNVLPFLNLLDSSAQKVGAVNVVKREEGKLIGYNSDLHGFKESVLNDHRSQPLPLTALILGSGGASKAVEAALHDLGITYQVVSRQKQKENLTYRELHEDPSIVEKTGMIINTTPLGMHPAVDSRPDIPYDAIHMEQYIFDLVYNPEETAFMLEASQRGARTKNGLEMLYLQADKAWEIWNK